MLGWTYIVVADRGFGNVKVLRQLMDELKMLVVIRVKSTIGVRRNVSDTFVPVNRIAYTRGCVQDLGRVDFTRSNTLRGVRIVRLHDLEQQEPWVLATNLDAPARTVVRLYGMRFLIEEMFRDGKDKSNGFALAGSRITDSKRLSRMFGIWSMTYVFLTLAGLHALKRDWHLRYESNSRLCELAWFRLGRCVILDEERGPRVTVQTLLSALPAMARRIGHWDWRPRPWEELKKWEILPKRPRSKTDSRRLVRTERPCDARLRVRVAELLKAKEITQVELAQRLERGQGNVSNVLRGTASFPRTWFPVLMEVLEFTKIDELLGDTGWTRPSRKGSRSGRVLVTDTTPIRVPRAKFVANTVEPLAPGSEPADPGEHNAVCTDLKGELHNRENTRWVSGNFRVARTTTLE